MAVAAFLRPHYTLVAPLYITALRLNYRTTLPGSPSAAANVSRPSRSSAIRIIPWLFESTHLAGREVGDDDDASAHDFVWREMLGEAAQDLPLFEA